MTKLGWIEKSNLRTLERRLTSAATKGQREKVAEMQEELAILFRKAQRLNRLLASEEEQ